MKIKICNIGKIKQKEILLNGITIVAGENNTGKSTIGKTLFALLRGMNEWETNYYIQCSNKLYNVIKKESEKLEDFCLKNTNAARRRTNRANELIRKISNDKEFIAQVEDFQISENNGKSNQTREYIDAYQQVESEMEHYCKEYVSLYQKNCVEEIYEKNRVFFSGWIDTMLIILKDEVELDEVVLQARVLKESFNQCFRTQYKSISADAKMSEVTFQDEDSETTFCISKMEEKLSKPIRTKKGIYFVESPKLFDEIGRGGYMFDPCAELRSLMVPNSFISTTNMRNRRAFFSFVSEFPFMEDDIPEEAKDVMNMLVEEMKGQAEYYVKEGIKFKERDSSTAFFAQNVSTGLKAMAFLEYAIRVGAIQKNDILILDEPEINLHPEWQVIYARALVLLQKTYNLTILITSHSPYFIRAIECFSDIYNTMEDLNVYLVERYDENKYKMSNVMESEYGLADLYEILSAPFDSLQEEINKKYSS